MRVLSSFFGILLSASIMAAPVFDRIVMFGDSLSDNGNLYKYMRYQVPQSPPYFKGRFTNGYIWIELLAKKLSLHRSENFLLDYAFGGAGITNSNDEDIFTLRTEIDTYLATHNNNADPESLFVIWIGANNYLALPEDADEEVETVTEGIRRGIQSLIDKGAKNFLILNIPDLSKTPIAAEFGEIDKMKEYSSKHNQRLLQVVEDFKISNANLHWYFFDVETMLNQAIADPQNYGLTNVTDTCYEALVEKGAPETVVQMSRTLTIAQEVTACEGYLFFDPVHPTTVAHGILADEVYSLLASSID